MSYVDDIIKQVSGAGNNAGQNMVGWLQRVGATETEATEIVTELQQRRRRGGYDPQNALAVPPSPPFGRSGRGVLRRAPLGMTEATTGNKFFTLAGVIGATTTMQGKVSRVFHGDRLLIVPSATGVIITSIMVGDEEQLAAPGAPVELYSAAALTDRLPDNFSPLGSGTDFMVTLMNTTAGVITGTIGLKGAVER